MAATGEKTLAQRTKTIADWWFSHRDFDWLNLQKQKWWLLAGSSQPCPQGLFLLQWGRGCMAVFCHPVIPPPPPLHLACVQTRATKEAGDFCTQAAFHSANIPISPGLLWPCAPLNWHNSPEKDGVVGKLTSPLFGFWRSQSRLQSLPYPSPVEGTTG